MSKKQLGFTLVEALLILLVAGVLVVAGYFVWHRQQSAPSPEKVATSTYSGSTVSLPLFSESNSSSRVSFVVPDGWVADKESDNFGFFADDLTYKPGAKFTHSNQANKRDIDRFMLSVTDANGVPKEYKSYKKSDFGTINGNKAMLYYYKFSKGEHIGNVQMQGGETEHMYFITKGNDAVMASYYILAGDKDQQQLINQVIHTIKF
jgi:hypothetical protein